MRGVAAITEGVTPTKFTAPTTGEAITTVVTEATIEVHEATTGLAVITEVIGITIEATTATTGGLGTAIEDQR